jgi:predicted nucleotidyltransferase
MRAYFIHKNKDFHTRELARRTGFSAPYVMKELHNLKNLGILVERREGNMVFYGINKSSSIVEDLKRLFLKTESLGKELFDALRKDEKMIKYALIYGSFAKGTEVTSSDIDLLIIGEIKEDRVVQLVMKTQSRIGREINYIVWSKRDLQEKARQKVALLREISRTPVIMIIGDIDEFKRSVKESSG